MTSLAVSAFASTALALSSAFALAAADPVEVAIGGVMEEFVKPGEPGCTVGVTQDGVLAHALAFGMADLGRGRALDTHAIFDLASISKQFTAFALLLLEQDGKLKLDEPLVKYVPELAASAQVVTLRQLMHHTGGLRDYIELLYMKGRNNADGATIHETVQLLARQAHSNGPPGVEYAYSNTGYFLLGVVIARASGDSFAEFLRKRIFEPLGMNATRVVDRYPDGIAARVRGYARNGSRFAIDESAWEQVGDGGVFSNLHDLARWDENFYTAKLGGRALVDRMYEVGLLNSGESTGYAAGLSVFDSRGLRWIAHGGSWAGHHSRFLRAPGEHTSVVVLCNRDDADTYAIADAIAAIVLKDKLGRAEPAEDESPESVRSAAEWEPKDLSRFAGAYFSDEAGVRCVLDERSGRLVLESCADGESLRPGKAGEFITEDGKSLRFPSSGDEADGFVYWSNELRGLAFTKVKEVWE